MQVLKDVFKRMFMWIYLIISLRMDVNYHSIKYKLCEIWK
jgi:hypothetical protein